MSRLLALAFILFCFEIGIVLVVVPWSHFWDNNFLLNYAPSLRPIILSNFFRTFVTALGAIDLLIGVSELKQFLKSLGIVRRIAE